MSRQDEIRKALGAHGLWKSRLRTAIVNARADPAPAAAAVDDVCEFGRWLYSLPPAERDGAHFAKVKELHAKFHEEAAGVLRLVEAGRVDDAANAIGAGSAFDHATTQLTITLMDWSRAA